ncbi:phosphodiester glycosidase family protein, partial [Synechococcus sp. B60.1]|uniref:phosphodiester glycosidase family protein n=1 Tax=Synechococcus sp. B60.1 TaxID=2964522 RepID=UPI0039C3F037
PFDPDTMTQLDNLRQLMPDVTDLFVAGLWLVKDGRALSPREIDSFRLSSAAEFRPRAFFGVDNQDQVVIGVTKTHVNAAILASLLPKTGIREAVLLDSGFSTSLVYQGEILATGHAGPNQPSRPVPHAILLYDLTRLWREDPQQQASANSPGNRLEGLVQLLPSGDQEMAKAQLESILAGQRLLRRGERGPAVVAVQLGLSRLAAQQGRLDLLPSGPDGVYGQELAQAVAELLLDDTPLVAGTATPSSGGDAIDAQLLQRLLERVNLAPASVLVDTRLERPTWPLERKPTRKLLPRAALE